MSGSTLVDRVRQRLIDTVGDSGDPSPALVAQALRAEGVVLGDDAVLSLVTTLRDELGGAGPLEPLLRDPSVTDVLVNGPDEVWVDRGSGLHPVGIRFTDAAAVRRLAQRLASGAGRRLDEAAPFVDAQLPDGSRLHAVIPPIARGSAVISLRVPRRRAFTLEELVAAGTISAEGARWMRAILDSRLAFVISGGTGTGKTTILAALLGLVDPGDRILIVEDSAELRPAHPHVICLQSRPANLEGAGLITLRDLVRQALRMRPDRVVVGEVRGAEVVDLLSALNTGHEGGCGTVHANSAADVPARLEALGLTAGLPRIAVHSLVAAGLDAVIHLQRDDTGHRRVRGIHVTEGDADGFVHTVPALEFDSAGATIIGPGMERLTRRLQGA
jgi:pilus assembly protein CpaF